MSNASEDLIKTAKKWTGYLEKKSNKDLDSFLSNAGSNNYTCFARDYYKHTGYNLQAQPWCAMYVSECFVQAFGLETAKKLLGGALYHYCPTGVNQFKAAGRWSKVPEPGAVLFFTNGTRAYHTGIVTEVTSSRVKTIEGNTSGASGVVENGGGVCAKSYDKTYSRILGYGLPDWSLVKAPEPVIYGWNRDSQGKYRYCKENGKYAANEWLVINHHWYLFGKDGSMLTGWKRWNGSSVIGPEEPGDWYYLDETPDGPLEGACWHERAGGFGGLEIWYID